MISARTAIVIALSSVAVLGPSETQAKSTYSRARTASSRHHQAPAPTQQAPAPPKPSPIPELPPADLPPQAPQVAFVNGRLTIEAQNATLADICEAVGKQTGAQIDAPPDESERFVVHLSGSPREVLASLLNGSQLGYIILASADDPNMVRKVVLTKLESSGAGHNQPAPQTTAAMFGRRGSPATRGMLAAQQADQEREPPETTGSNGPNPAPLDTSIPFQPAAPTAAASGSDQQPISAPGQFMQELYRLRAQQQQQQNQQAQPPQTPPQQ